MLNAYILYPLPMHIIPIPYPLSFFQIPPLFIFRVLTLITERKGLFQSMMYIIFSLSWKKMIRFLKGSKGTKGEQINVHELSQIEKNVFKRRWSKVEKELSNQRCNGTSNSSEDSSARKKYISIHFLLQFKPPLNIVSAVIENNPECLFEADHKKRLPIHTAVQNGASCEVIKYILKKINASSVLHQDSDGKTPLILLTEGWTKSSKSWKSEDSVRSCEEIIRMLVKLNPKSLGIEDADGMTALEHAIFAKLPFEIISQLQRNMYRYH